MWGLLKMTVILQMTLSSWFSLWKLWSFWLKFQWNKSLWAFMKIVVTWLKLSLPRPGLPGSLKYINVTQPHWAKPLLSQWFLNVWKECHWTRFFKSSLVTEINFSKSSLYSIWHYVLVLWLFMMVNHFCCDTTPRNIKWKSGTLKFSHSRWLCVCIWTGFV